MTNENFDKTISLYTNSLYYSKTLNNNGFVDNMNKLCKRFVLYFFDYFRKIYNTFDSDENTNNNIDAIYNYIA